MNCSIPYVTIQYAALAWCHPTTLCLIWVIFCATAILLLQQREKHKLRDNGESSGFVHFKDLPSPISYPVLGHLTQLGLAPHVVLSEWAEKYGSLFRIKLGFQDALVVTGLDTIRNAAIKQSSVFAGRPNLETMKVFCNGISLSFSNYSSEWCRQKSFAKSALSLYTTGRDPTKRTAMESSATKHANNLVDQLLRGAKNEGATVTPRDHIFANVVNAICTICFGQDFELKDPKLEKLLSINRNFDAAMGASQLVNFWPILKHFPIVGRPFKSLKNHMNAFYDIVSNFLESHWVVYDDDALHDITDCLFHESEKQRKKLKGINEHELQLGEKNGFSDHNFKELLHNGVNQNQTNNVNPFSKYFFCNKYGESENNSKKLLEDENSDKNVLELRRRIIYTTGDIFGAGYDTISATIDWAVLYLAVFPDTQAKILEETSRVVTPSEDPSFRLHSSRCPYTLAWMYELMRHTSIIPLLIPHSTTEPTILENCYIPKGVLVYFNAWQAHHDPKLWDKPDEFKPERFLQEDEEESRTLRNERISTLLCWGVGKRKCLGETLSKHQIFIFLCVILRRCRIEAYQPGFEPVLPWPVDVGLAIKPKRYRVKVTPR